MDRNRSRRVALQQRIFEQNAVTSVVLRQQAGTADPNLPIDLRPFVEQVHAAAYRVSDQQVSTLRQNRSDDEIFEVTIAASVGKARTQMDHALLMLQQSICEEK
jgi:hypothetical protein